MFANMYMCVPCVSLVSTEATCVSDYLGIGVTGYCKRPCECYELGSSVRAMSALITE